MKLQSTKRTNSRVKKWTWIYLFLAVKLIWRFFSWTACKTLSGPCTSTRTKRPVLRVNMGIHCMMWACFWPKFWATWLIHESGQRGSISCSSSRRDARRFRRISDMSDIPRPDWSSRDNSKQARLRFFPPPSIRASINKRRVGRNIKRDIVWPSATDEKNILFPILHTYSVSTQVVTLTSDPTWVVSFGSHHRR